MPIEGINEQALIERAKDGDRAAQEDLVRLYEKRVYGLIVKMVANREDARDILQDTMVKALTSLHQYDPGHAFRSWLFRIATNKSIDFLRRRKLEAAHFTYEDELPIERIANGARRADEAVAARLDWETVERCMERIEPRYRAVLFLRYRDGLAYKEIAHALSIPMGTVKVLLHRGRHELKEEVRKEVGSE
jgi:RNA polymerase sigma-70 factor (ECF subfamily)